MKKKVLVQMLREPNHYVWNPYMYAKAGIELIFQMTCEMEQLFTWLKSGNLKWG